MPIVSRVNISHIATALVAWGVLAFGGVYPWAYWPLFSCAAATSLWVLWRRRAAIGSPLLVWSGVSVLAAVALQLVPLPRGVLTRLSGTDRLLNAQDVLYATSGTGHAVSISPARTAEAVVILVVLYAFVLAVSTELTRLRDATPRQQTRTNGLFALCRHIVMLAAMVALLAVCQSATFNGRIYWLWAPQAHNSHPFGPFVNRNHFAGWMVMAACLGGGYVAALLSTARVRDIRDWRSRAIWFSSPEASHIVLAMAAVLVSSIALVWSLSRSGIIGYVAGIGVLIVASQGRRARPTAAAVALASCVVCALMWTGADTLTDWYGRSETFVWRIALWKDSIPALADFLPLGSGLNTYERVMLEYPLQYPALNPVHAHNEYLQLAIEGGLLVGVPAAAALLVVAREIRQRLQQEQNPGAYWLRVGAVAALFGVGVQSCADFTLRLPGVSVLAAVALAIALHRPHASRPAAREAY